MFAIVVNIMRNLLEAVFFHQLVSLRRVVLRHTSHFAFALCVGNHITCHRACRQNTKTRFRWEGAKSREGKKLKTLEGLYLCPLTAQT